MTSVPKPLKFLTPQYEKLVETYNKYGKNDEFKKNLADLCSVIGMVAAPDSSNDMLDYCLKGSMNMKSLHEWGHEYLRTLAGQIGHKYDDCVEKNESSDDLMKLVDLIVPRFIDHNEEPEAVDLMMETESLSKLPGFCNERNYDRVCRYLTSCS